MHLGRDAHSAFKSFEQIPECDALGIFLGRGARILMTHTYLGPRSRRIRTPRKGTS